MGSKIYVGGLPYSATESEIEALFGEHGTVESARVITDKYTGQSRGFGFVEMASPSEAEAAISALHSTEMGGRTLTVNEAKPMAPRSGGSGGGFGGGGGDRGDRGGRGGRF
ncbi:MAG: RNA-binding protein [Nitrospirae bacterium]|nr:RNA-binding protein [Nitrospirota bacterium]MDA1303263.1 RNA-binding protein [Nitrospirota bacterium]